MHRDEKAVQCKGVDTAYWWPPTQGDSSRKYDAIIWCDTFFTVLDDHTTVEKRILADTTGKFELNTRNMRSTGRLSPEILPILHTLTFECSNHRSPSTAAYRALECGDLRRRM